MVSTATGANQKSLGIKLLGVPGPKYLHTSIFFGILFIKILRKKSILNVQKNTTQYAKFYQENFLYAKKNNYLQF